MDERIGEIMEGMLTLSEESKDMLIRVYEALAIINEKEKACLVSM